MKSALLTLAWFVCWIALCLSLGGCVTTTTTSADGSVTVTKQPAPGVLPFAGAMLEAYSLRAIIVREEKGGPVDVYEARSKSVDSNEMRFRELQAISPEEISARWKP